MSQLIDFLDKPEQATTLDLALGKGVDWLDKHRLRGLQIFQQQGLPNRKQAHWRYSNLSPIAKQCFNLPSSLTLTDTITQQIEAAKIKDCHTVVFINGALQAPLSDLKNLPEAITFIDFQQSVDHTLIRSLLGNQLELALFPFAALNTAYMNSGFLLSVAEKFQVDKAIQLIFYNEAANQQAHFSFPRQLIHLAEAASCHVITTHLGPSDKNVYFCNPLTEISLKANARLHLSKTLNESPGAFHIASTHATLSQQAEFNYRFYGWQAAMAREETLVHLDETLAKTDIRGSYYFTDQQQFSMNTQLIHHANNTHSHTHVNGLAGGHSRTSFDGRIIAMQEVKGIKADLTNRNIVLSKTAEMNSNPDLEIYTDDVQCSHGSTIGQLDEEALFYLQTRGLDDNAARAILIQGFLKMILDTESHSALKIKLYDMLATLTGHPHDIDP